MDLWVPYGVSSSSLAVPSSAPHVYPLVPLTCPGQAPIGCLAKDFFPTPISITWTSNGGGDVETFPSQWVQGSYSASSLLVVPSTSVEGQSFQCKVEHNSTKSIITEVIEGSSLCCEDKPHPPLSVRLLADPNQSRPQDGVLLLCLLEGSGAGGAKVQWWEGQEPMGAEQEAESCGGCQARSSVVVSREKWELGTEFRCRGKAQGSGNAAEAVISSFCMEPKAVVEASILPPALEDLLLHQNSSVSCVLSNVKSSEGVRFSWSRENGSSLDGEEGPAEELANGLYRMSSSIRICAEEWASGEEFSCRISVPELQEPIVRSIRKELAPIVRPPLVFVSPPSSEELSLQETATLTCLATGFLPKAIVVRWTQEERPVSIGNVVTYGPDRDGDAFSLVSLLRVPAAAWLRGERYACVIGHQGLPLGFVHKGLDKSAGKPMAVNVSVVLSDADGTCY